MGTDTGGVTGQGAWVGVHSAVAGLCAGICSVVSWSCCAVVMCVRDGVCCVVVVECNDKTGASIISLGSYG